MPSSVDFPDNLCIVHSTGEFNVGIIHPFAFYLDNTFKILWAEKRVEGLQLSFPPNQGSDLHVRRNFRALLRHS